MTFACQRPVIQTYVRFIRNLHLLQISLNNEVLDVGATYDVALATLEVDAPVLRLHDAAFAHDAHANMDLLRRLLDSAHDVQFISELAAVVHEAPVVLSKVIDLVWTQFRPEIGVGEEMGKSTTARPV